jgi:hypothetical protein
MITLTTRRLTRKPRSCDLPHEPAPLTIEQPTGVRIRATNGIRLSPGRLR